jgi:predicted DNA-binding protein
MGMTVQFDNPELQAKVDQWVSATGRPAEELLEDVVAGYFDEVAEVRQALDARYDEIKSGQVKMIPADVAYSQLMDSLEARRPKA